MYRLLFTILLVQLVTPLSAQAEIEADKALQKCIAQNLTAKVECRPVDKTMQAFKLLLESIEKQDGSILCKGYLDAGMTPPIIWDMPRIVYSDGEQREAWIKLIPEPNDPAMFFLNASAKGEGRFALSCGPVFLELYENSDGYFGEHAGSLLGVFLLNAEARKDDFHVYSKYLERMKEELIYFNSIESIRLLADRYEHLDGSIFKTKMLAIIKEALRESKGLNIHREKSAP